MSGKIKLEGFSKCITLRGRLVSVVARRLKKLPFIISKSVMLTGSAAAGLPFNFFVVLYQFEHGYFGRAAVPQGEYDGAEAAVDVELS